jgi:hypothetical protein
MLVTKHVDVAGSNLAKLPIIVATLSSFAVHKERRENNALFGLGRSSLLTSLTN